MRACVQRVTEGCVTVAGESVSKIGKGLVVLLGVATEDKEQDAKGLAEKIVQLRIFADDQGKMNRSLLDVCGQMLVVSQFTLLGDCRKGRRPSFAGAAPPDVARALYTTFVHTVTDHNIDVATGRFQQSMRVSLVNDGPVTLLLNSDKTF